MDTDPGGTFDAIAAAGRLLHARGWVPATSGNFSVRLASGAIAITASGKDKSRLAATDIMQIDLQGKPLEGGKPSAETPLHLQLYARDPAIGAVLHTHSPNATVISLAASRTLRIEGFELLKALSGIQAHTAAIDLPVFDNSQDIAALAAVVEQHMTHTTQGYAYLIRGHGLYTWGKDLVEALRHLEALEFLLECRRLQGGIT